MSTLNEPTNEPTAADLVNSLRAATAELKESLEPVIQSMGWTEGGGELYGRLAGLSLIADMMERAIAPRVPATA